MLAIADIPDKCRVGHTDGENIASFASGVQTAIRDAVGQPGLEALDRFAHAGFLFRSSEIGRSMNRSSAELGGPLGEQPQLVDFAAGALSATTFVGALDLTAAALRRLYLGPIDPNDPEREADVRDFPDWQSLPDAPRGWLAQTRGVHAWQVLRSVRDAFVHRSFPLHITITIGDEGMFFQEIEISGARRRLLDFLNESRGFVIDRLVAAGLVMTEYARSVASSP